MSAYLPIMLHAPIYALPRPAHTLQYLYNTRVCACAEPACRCTIRDGWTWAWSFCHGVMSQAVSGRTDRLWRVCSVGASAEASQRTKSARVSRLPALACMHTTYVHARSCMHAPAGARRLSCHLPCCLYPAVSILFSIRFSIHWNLSLRGGGRAQARRGRVQGTGCRVQGSGLRPRRRHRPRMPRPSRPPPPRLPPDELSSHDSLFTRLALRRMCSLHTTLSSHASPPAG